MWLLGETGSQRRCATLRSRPTPRTWRRTCTARLWSWIICVVVTVAGQPGDAPETGRGIGGLVYGCTELPSEGAPADLSAADVLGGCGGRGVRDSERHFLVNAYASKEIGLDLVLHRPFAAGLRAPDFRRRDLRSRRARRDQGRVGEPARGCLVGWTSDRARLFLYISVCTLER